MRPTERPPVLIRWIARPDACDDCKRIAAGSPYEQLPTWPGLGDTRCVTTCRCAVEGTRAGNVMATATATAPPVPPAAARSAARQRTPAAPPPPLEPQPATFTADPPFERAPDTAAPEPLPAPRPARPTSLRIKPLEGRWTLALGALIFIAVVVAMFSPH